MSNTAASPFKRPGFLIAAAVVAIIVITAVVLIVSGLAKPADPKPDPSGSAPTSSEEPGADDESVCGLGEFESSSSLEAAPDASWEIVGTVAAPTDAEGAGPGVEEGGFRSCYAHTAEGALFAAVNYFAVASDSRQVDRLPDLIAPGAGRDAAIANKGAAGVGGSGTRVQVAGFKVNSYSVDEAVIDVAWSVTSNGGALVSLPMVMTWADGDWKVTLDDDGKLPISASPLTNLGGYIAWAGV